jgi:hypothetical protein
MNPDFPKIFSGNFFSLFDPFIKWGIFFPKIFLGFSNKNTHKVFFTHTLRLRDYPPILGIKGGRGVGRIRPPITGEGYRGVITGRGITKTP